MRVKIDENMHPDVGALLRANGHDAVTVWDEGLRGKSDAHIISRCRSEQRAIITLDVAFGDITSYPPEQFHGIVVLRLENQSRKHLLAVFPKVLSLLQAETLRGH